MFILFCIFNVFKEVFHCKNQESKSTGKHIIIIIVITATSTAKLCVLVCSCNLKLAFRGIVSFGPSDISDSLRRVILLLCHFHSWQKQSVSWANSLIFRAHLQEEFLTLVTDLKRGVRGMWSEAFFISI